LIWLASFDLKRVCLGFEFTAESLGCISWHQYLRTNLVLTYRNCKITFVSLIWLDRHCNWCSSKFYQSKHVRENRRGIQECTIQNSLFIYWYIKVVAINCLKKVIFTDISRILLFLRNNQYNFFSFSYLKYMRQQSRWIIFDWYK
jgi:hypothetical protein